MPSNKGAPYIMLPGARLYIGPHGRPEESLGACCSNCASGRSCSGAPLGDLSNTKLATIIGITAGAAIGLAILFPKAWDRYMDALWK